VKKPLKIISEIAPGADPNVSPSGWEWASSGDGWALHRREHDGLTITTGRDDEDSETTPGSASYTIDDRAGAFGPKNVLSPLYGKIGINTPDRHSLVFFDDDFARTVSGGWGIEPNTEYSWKVDATGTYAVAGNKATVANLFAGASVYCHPDAGLSGIGVFHGSEIDTRVTVSLNVVPSGNAAEFLTGIRMKGISDGYWCVVSITPSGVVNTRIERIDGSGTTVIAASFPSGITYTANLRLIMKCRTVGNRIMMKVWKASDVEPPDWNQSVVDTTYPTGAVILRSWRRASNTDAGLVFTYENFRTLATLWTGQIPEWPVRWPDKSGNDVITPIESSGILRWLSQGQPPLRSPLTQRSSNGAITAALWPLEDGPDATAAANTLGGGTPASATGVDFGSDDAPAGALSSAVLNVAGSSGISGKIKKWPFGDSSGYGVHCIFRFPSLPSGLVRLEEISAVGAVAKWIVSVNSTGIRCAGYDVDGNTVVTNGPWAWTLDPTAWFGFRLRVEQASPGNCTVTMSWYQVTTGGATIWAGSANYSGDAGRPTGALIIAPVDGTLATSFSVGIVGLLTQSFIIAADGYTGETDTVRVARVFAEAGIECFVEGGTSAGAITLGPQPRTATALEVARDAETAGLGLLYEKGPIAGYLPHGARGGFASNALVLDWSAGHIATTPEFTYDDQRIRNSWTSRRPNGSERTSENAASIARFRRFADSGEVNVQLDDQLQSNADWHVAVGTIDALRVTSITIDLLKNPSLIPLWYQSRVGYRVTIKNLPLELSSAQTMELMIEGYTLSIGKYHWTVTLNLSPARPWISRRNWGAAAVARWDSLSTKLAADVTSTAATTFQIVSAWREDCWALPSGVTPIDITWDVNGEPVVVTAVTAPGGGPGAYTQTATVTRHPKLAKKHYAGEVVHLLEPTLWGI
jgi:hypothetical protein